MSRSIAIAACASLVLLAAACGDSPVAPTSPAPVSPVDDQVAKGALRMKYVFGTNVIDNYIFSATKDDFGHVTGGFAMYQARFFAGQRRESNARVLIAGKIVCLEVIGHVARLGGYVVASNFKQGIPLGQPITFSVSDNGSSGPDRASPLLGGVDPYAYCANGLPYPEHSIGAGGVTVIEDDGR